MDSNLERLIEIDRADRAIARLSDEVTALPKHLAAIESKLADIKARVQGVQEAIKAQDATRRRHESDIQDLQQKISKLRSQSLDVKTNEQYRALLHEIEFAETEIRKREDHILEGMVTAETLAGELKRANEDLKAQTAENQREQESARALTAKDELELLDWREKRRVQREHATAEALAIYDRVSRARKTALSEGITQQCTACHVMIRPQTWNEVKSNQHLIACDSCGRILYYDPAHEPVVEEKEKKPKKARRNKVEPTQETADSSRDEGIPAV